MAKDVATTPPPGADLTYVPALDGLRAIAAALVMFFHQAISATDPTMQSVATLGRSGVDLFFVLSGFLITRILLDSRGRAGSFKRFYARRTLRIFPLYYFGLSLYVIALPLIYGEGPSPLTQQLWSWLYLENIPETFHSIQGVGPPHYWSLAVEEHFYLLWPALVLLLPQRWLGRAMVAVIVMAVGLRAVFAAFEIETYYFTLTRMDALAMGGLLALALRQAPPAWLQASWRVGLVVAPIAILALFVLFQGQGMASVQIIKHSLTPLFFLCVLAFVLADPFRRPAKAVLELAPLRWLGRISYGLYVYHPLCFGLTKDLGPPVVSTTLGVLLTIAVAAASFRFLETPFLRMKDRFGARASDPASVPAP